MTDPKRGEVRNIIAPASEPFKSVLREIGILEKRCTLVKSMRFKVNL